MADEQTLRFRVGVFFLMVLVVGLLLIVLVGDFRIGIGRPKTIKIIFDQAPGVRAGIPVRKSGITIGRVTDVQFDENENVVVLVEIDENRRVYSNEMVRIASATLIGDPILEFVPAQRGPDQPKREEILDGDVIENGMSGSNPIDIVVNLEPQVRSALQRFEGAAKSIEDLASTLQKTVGDNQDRVPRLLAKAEKSIDEFNSTLTSVRETFGTPELREKLRTALDQVPNAMDDLRGTLGKAQAAFGRIDALLEDFGGVTERAEANLANLEGFTKSLGEDGPEILKGLRTSVDKVDRVLDVVAEFGESINESEGTLGLLIRDRSLYDRINRVAGSVERTAGNIELVTRKLRPIIDDVRVISDKIAKDPGGEIGVRGALSRRPAGAGIKGNFQEPWINASRASYFESVFEEE